MSSWEARDLARRLDDLISTASDTFNTLNQDFDQAKGSLRPLEREFGGCLTQLNQLHNKPGGALKEAEVDALVLAALPVQRTIKLLMDEIGKTTHREPTSSRYSTALGNYYKQVRNLQKVAQPLLRRLRQQSSLKRPEQRGPTVHARLDRDAG
ncbi:hypothetical protein D5S17_24180 [Pseudonocardiaceae bacterium YIM PH 21723]|nr:hypothetical protein D5S17_24180 [Pseudonocardiaceae bacterium YIM PH 21723]